MPLSVSAAILRFQRRLRVAAFVGGAAGAVFVLALIVSAGLLAARYAGLLPISDSSWSPSPLTWPAPVWLALLAAAALLFGWLRFRRSPVGPTFAAEQLERRLGTGGLLLVASEGVDLDPGFRHRLEQDLERAGDAMPVVRWRRLLPRPLAAVLLLIAVGWLPPAEPASAPGRAVAVAVERLAEDVEQLAASPVVPPELSAELRAAARRLEARAAAGEPDLWRDVDQLEARLDRERALANTDEAGSGDSAAGPAAGSAGSGSVQAAAANPAPTPAELAAAMQSLAGTEGRDGLAAAAIPPSERKGELAAELADAATEMAAMGGIEQMPEFLQRAMIDAALGAAESALAEIDPETLRSLLPDDLGELRQLAESLQGVAQQMAGEQPSPGGVPDLQELSAASKARLAELAQRLERSLDGMRDSTRDGMRDGAGAGPDGQVARGGDARPGGGERAQDGEAGRSSRGGNGADGAGAPRRGPGHTALRLTQDPVVGGVGGNEQIALPAPEQSELPRAWVPMATRRVEPDGERSPGAGRAAAAGTGGAGAGAAGDVEGGASWQLRLMPRHREVVRRFFAGSGERR